MFLQGAVLFIVIHTCLLVPHHCFIAVQASETTQTSICNRAMSMIWHPAAAKLEPPTAYSKLTALHSQRYQTDSVHFCATFSRELGKSQRIRLTDYA